MNPWRRDLIGRRRCKQISNWPPHRQLIALGLGANFSTDIRGVDSARNPRPGRLPFCIVKHPHHRYLLGTRKMLSGDTNDATTSVDEHFKRLMEEAKAALDSPIAPLPSSSSVKAANAGTAFAAKMSTPLRKKDAGDDDAPPLSSLKARLQAINRATSNATEVKSGFIVEPLLNAGKSSSAAHSYDQLNTPNKPPLARTANDATDEETEEDEFKELEKKYTHLVDNVSRSTGSMAEVRARLDAAKAAMAQRSSSKAPSSAATSIGSHATSDDNPVDTRELARKIHRLGHTITDARRDLDDEDAAVARYRQSVEQVRQAGAASREYEQALQEAQAVIKQSAQSRPSTETRDRSWRPLFNRIINAVIVLLVCVMVHLVLSMPNVHEHFARMTADPVLFLQHHYGQRRQYLHVLAGWRSHAEHVLQRLFSRWNPRVPA